MVECFLSRQIRDFETESFMRLLPLFLGFGLVLSVACSKKKKDDDDDDGDDGNTPGGNGGEAGSGTIALTLSADSSAGLRLARGESLTANFVTDTLSFTPTGLKLPVMKITIAKDDTGQEEQNLYACANAAEADCLVDLANQEALDALATAAGKASIRPGTYERLSLYTCAEGKGGTTATVAYLKGSADFAGTTWRTDAAAAGGIDDAGTGAAEEAEVGNWSCSTKNVLLSPGVTVSSGSDSVLTVLVDNTEAANFGTSVSNGKGGCKMDGSTDGGNSGKGFCMTYPALIPYIGDGKATMKRFAVTHYLAASVGAAVFDETKANALVIVPVDADGKGLMAYGRTLYTETSALPTDNNGAANDTAYGGPTYVTETNFKTFAVNEDGSVAFEQGGSEDGNAGVFAAFQMATHDGIVTTKDGTKTWAYRATLLE